MFSGPVEISFKFKKIIIFQIKNNELLTTVFEMQKQFYKRQNQNDSDFNFFHYYEKYDLLRFERTGTAV